MRKTSVNISFCTLQVLLMCHSVLCIEIFHGYAKSYEIDNSVSFYKGNLNKHLNKLFNADNEINKSLSSNLNDDKKFKDINSVPSNIVDRDKSGTAAKFDRKNFTRSTRSSITGRQIINFVEDELLGNKYVSKREIDKEESQKPIKERFNGTEVQSYAKDMRSKVNHVVSEAKEVLSNTGRIVSGLRRVISGAKRLTDFTNNAVKFAKYFAMEPSNATVDYFEEKAVIAVLQAQKASAEAKIAAVIAREAAHKANMMMKKFKKAYKHVNINKLLKKAKFIESQAVKSSNAAKESSFKVKEAKHYAISTDNALRKMVEVNQNDDNEKTNEDEEDQNTIEENASHNLSNESSDFECSNNSISAEKNKQELAGKNSSEKEMHDRIDYSGDQSEQDKETTDLRSLYENVKATIAATEMSNSSNASTNHTSDILPVLSLQGGGDENEVIANDYDSLNKEKLTDTSVIEEQKQEINNGPLNLVVTVKRKKLLPEKRQYSSMRNASIENATIDPFNFKSVLNAGQHNEYNESLEPIDLGNDANSESIRSTISRISGNREKPLETANELYQGSNEMLKQYLFAKARQLQNSKRGLFHQERKRSKIADVYGYERNEYLANNNNPEYIWLPDMNG